jgi:hypothetical protein
MDDSRDSGTGNTARPGFRGLGLDLMGTLGLCGAHLPRGISPGAPAVAVRPERREQGETRPGMAHQTVNCA